MLLRCSAGGEFPLRPICEEHIEMDVADEACTVYRCLLLTDLDTFSRNVSGIVYKKDNYVFYWICLFDNDYIYIYIKENPNNNKKTCIEKRMYNNVSYVQKEKEGTVS